jgi:signal transduction histidine kinase
VQNIIAELETAAAGRALRIVLEAPNFINLVIAQPAEFDKLVRNVLETLLNDAAADTEIRVRIRLEPDAVTFELSNAGFGLPDEDLQRFLSGKGHAISEEFRILHECSVALQAWGGQFRASSEVGGGFRFEFTLPAVV